MTDKRVVVPEMVEAARKGVQQAGWGNTALTDALTIARLIHFVPA